jgi:hypothetical protein
MFMTYNINDLTRTLIAVTRQSRIPTTVFTKLSESGVEMGFQNQMDAVGQ